MRAKRDLVLELYDTFSGIGRHMAEKYPDLAWLYPGRASHWQALLTAREQGKGVAWQSFCAVPEILWAMDLIPMPMESIFGMLTGMPKGIVEYLNIADRYVPDHMCSSNRGMIGIALSEDIVLPDVIVFASQPCDSGLATFGNLAQTMGVPFFCIDTPYWDDESTVEYVAKELENLVSFLEEHTGRKMDLDRLREVIHYSNQAHYYYNKINELRRLKPCPLPGIMLGHNAGAFMATAGTPELADYCRGQYEYGAARAARGEGTIPDERTRIAWVFAAVGWDLRLFDWMEREHKAVAVMDMLSHYTQEPITDTSSYKKIYQGLARKSLRMPMGRESRGPAAYYIEAILSMCRDYQSDAAVFAGHIACKHNWAVIKMVKDAVQRELGIPFLVFEVDDFDPRVTTSASMRAKLSDFLSVMRPQ